MKLKFIRILFSFSIFLLIGLSIYNVSDIDAKWNSPEIYPADDLPDIVISHRDSGDDTIHYYSYDNNSLSYSSEKSAPLEPNEFSFENLFITEGIPELEIFNDKLLVKYFGNISIYDIDFNMISEKSFYYLGRIRSRDNYIYASKFGELTILNDELEVIGNISFDIPEDSWKTVHDIIIDGDDAFLLDNFVSPTYVYKLNISNVEDPSLTYEIDLTGVNNHLSSHWIDIVNDRWLIVEDAGTMVGEFQSVYFYSADDGSLINYYDTYSDSSWEGVPNFGWRIIASTDFEPAWLLVNEDDKYCLRRSEFNGKDEIFKHVIYLGIDMDKGYEDVCFKQYQDLLYISIRDILTVVDVKEEPKVVLMQKMDSIITDLEVYP